MINRKNWQDTKAFLAYHEGTLQNDIESIKNKRGHLRHLLEWAGEAPLNNVKTLEPTFPAYMAKHVLKGKAKFSGSDATLKTARQFFLFVRTEYSQYKSIPLSWIKTLQPSKRNAASSRLKEHKHYTLESILKIAALPAETLEVKRDIAGVCFLFLSGMRIAAFTSIPLECVNIKENEIYQLPEKGVMTKNRKAAVTHLLQVPELLAIVMAWDDLVRAELADVDLWYPVMKFGKDEFERGKTGAKHRGQGFSKRLKNLCARAGVTYLSPHKIRHGHVVYALKNVKDMEGLKAVSQNVMHNSIQITDAIYGGFSNSDVKRVVSAIGQSPIEGGKPSTNMQDFIAMFRLLLKDNPEALKILSTLGK